MKYLGGVVSFEDGVKTVEGDQFSPTRKVRVELNFSFDDADENNEDASLLSAMNKAQALVQEKLGIKAPTAAAKRKSGKEGPSVAETHETTTAAIAASSKVTAGVLSDKAKLEAEMFAAAAGKKPASDPAAIEDVPAKGAGVEDALADLEGEPEKPVTDADLNAAVKAKNGEIKDPVRIRGLAAEYNGGPGHTLAEIPQEKRQEFLAKLKALKAS